MNPLHFDALTRTLTRLRHHRPSRRTVLPMLGGVLAASLTPSLPASGRRKRKRRCKDGTRRCQGTCIAQEACCTDADCPSGLVCQDQDCVDPTACPPGERPCGLLCLQPGACCTDDECPAGEVCENTVCTTLGPCPPQPPFSPELTRCGRDCVDLRSDPRHCGACNKACESGQGCVDRVVVGDIVCCNPPGRTCDREEDPICCRFCDSVEGCGVPTGRRVCCLGSGDACSGDCDCCGTERCLNGHCTCQNVPCE
jgi:hypothetical protein